MAGDVSASSTRRRRRCLHLLRRFLLVAGALRRPSAGPVFLRNFTNKEIKRATSEFSTIIRTDPHGNIFKARFPDGFVAAVWQLNSSEPSETFLKDLQARVCVRHRHLVNIRGFSEGRNRFLIFDYMENGSLKDCLHDPLRTPLDWRTRLKITTSIAAAMEYLQYFCDPPVSNAPISSSNVFLDENFIPKLCNFGLIGSIGGNNNHITEQDAMFSEGLMKRSNVIFQFGVLILELITGQSFESEGVDLIHWIQNSGFLRSMHKMVDADLGNSYDTAELKCLLSIARWCTKTGERPASSIRQILRYLQKRIEVQSSVL